MSWHRHQYKFITLSEALNLPHDKWGNRIYPFEYCEICKRIPTSLIAEDSNVHPHPR